MLIRSPVPPQSSLIANVHSHHSSLLPKGRLLSVVVAVLLDEDGLLAVCDWCPSALPAGGAGVVAEQDSALRSHHWPVAERVVRQVSRVPAGVCGCRSESARRG
jgi:hypothetical protein